MDGIHDLGGRQGFGPIPIDADDPPHSTDWEARMWGISRSGVLGGGITIDWFRHAVERMVPSDYLAFPYFQKWCTTYLVLLIDNGAFTLDEVLRGHTGQRGTPPQPVSVDGALAANRAAAHSFEVESPTAPRFRVGDTVVTLRHMAAGHTRLPGYARGARGTVTAHHGAHLLPDKGARGMHDGDHLYTVAFSARELWGDTADLRDSVALEVWESYLVPS